MSQSDDDRSAVLGDRGEAAVLTEFLGYERAAIIRKVVDLPDAVAHRAGMPSGTSLAWLIKHLTASERLWFGGATIDEWEALSVLDANEPVVELVAAYERATQESDAVIAGWTDLNQVDEPANGRPRAKRGGSCSTRSARRLATRSTPTSCANRSTAQSVGRPALTTS